MQQFRCTWQCLSQDQRRGLYEDSKNCSNWPCRQPWRVDHGPISAQDTAVMQRDIKWQDAPSIGPGAKTAVIDGDPKSSGPFVMRLKLPPKTTIGACPPDY